MRESKFRAWDMDNLIMYYSDKLEENGEGYIRWCLDETGIYFEEPTPYPWCDPESIKYTRPNQKVMQYTGKQDRDGVEIYEEDIVTHHDVKGNLIVRWGNCLPGFMACEVGDDGQCFDLRYIKKVIGNTFENPELLV